MKFSSYGSVGSHIPLLFVKYVSSGNSKAFPRAGASNKGGMGKNQQFSIFVSVNISKTVADTATVTINRKSHIGFPLTLRSMTVDDLELL